MNRNEFLKKLREALELSLEKDAINDEIGYYDKYIEDEIAKGKNEKDVIEELGDPRLIAKTIKTVNGADNIVDANINDNTNGNSNTYERKSTDGNNTDNKKKYIYSTSGISCVIAFLIIFIVIVMVLRFFGFMLFGVTSLLSNSSIGFIVLVLIMVWLVVRRR